jgi:phosphomannomutase
MFNPTIFKSYDVRGIYPSELDEETMQKIGSAFVRFLGATKVLVGFDMRVSGQSLSDAFMRGCVQMGADVMNIGQVSTDALYFASGKYNLPGVMITASHNPKDFNGVKFCKAGAEPIGPDTGLLEIKSMVEKGEFVPAERPGTIEIKENIFAEFREHCYKFADISKINPLKIVVDAGNGMAGKMVPAVFEKLACEIVPMYFDLDGTFPNHMANPIEKENNAALVERIKTEKADLGLAFDGDADRVFFFDEFGVSLDSSFVTAMIAKKMLEKNSGAKIVYTVVVSKAVPEIVEMNGGEPLLTKVGHSTIKQVMKDSGAVFGGEHSGHYYFRDNYRADSGIIAALIVLEMISESGKKLSELIKEFQLWHKIDEINFPVTNKDAVIAKLREKFKDNIAQQFDGVTFDFGDWWFNIRASGTESLLRFNMEARTEELMNEKMAEVVALI